MIYGYTSEIANHVIDYGLWYQLHNSKQGNEQVMYVGWDRFGDKLWEIGIELCSGEKDDWAFHAQHATSYSRRQVRL